MLSSFYTTDRSVVWWQVACYGCLDVLNKVVFGYVLMSSYSIIERVESAEVAECAATQALPLPQVLTQMFTQLCVLWICVSACVSLAAGPRGKPAASLCRMECAHICGFACPLGSKPLADYGVGSTWAG